MEKYGTAILAADDKIIRRMRFACWVAKGTDTHSEYIIILLFHNYTCYVKASQNYVYT
jgi:hypothetical protein